MLPHAAFCDNWPLTQVCIPWTASLHLCLWGTRGSLIQEEAWPPYWFFASLHFPPLGWCSLFNDCLLYVFLLFFAFLLPQTCLRFPYFLYKLLLQKPCKYFSSFLTVIIPTHNDRYQVAQKPPLAPHGWVKSKLLGLTFQVFQEMAQSGFLPWTQSSGHPLVFPSCSLVPQCPFHSNPHPSLYQHWPKLYLAFEWYPLLTSSMIALNPLNKHQYRSFCIVGSHNYSWNEFECIAMCLIVS